MQYDPVIKGDLERKCRAFFEARFNREPESDPVYFQEWLDRFYSGHPEAWMDFKSKQIYYSL